MFWVAMAACRDTDLNIAIWNKLQDLPLGPLAISQVDLEPADSGSKSCFNYQTSMSLFIHFGLCKILQ